MEINSNRVLMGLGAALEASTAAGRKSNGWVRLARFRSFSEAKPGEKAPTYVLAIRPLVGEKGYQLGCSCPDWMHRRSKTGELCKHQTAFLAHAGGTKPKAGKWLYRAGSAFLGLFQWR